MQLNKICLSAIILFLIFALLKFIVKLGWFTWKLFILAIFICIILGVFGFFKGDEF